MTHDKLTLIRRAALCVGVGAALVLFSSFGAARHASSAAASEAPVASAELAVPSAAPVASAAPSPSPSAIPDPKGLPLDRQAALSSAIRANGDAVAWLVIPGAGVDSAVMQGADNAQYLQLDELGNYSEWGCYYADCRDVFSARDKLVDNTVIFGHSQSDCDAVNGLRFTTLHRYTDAEYVQANPYIYLSIPGADMVFEIAAVFFTDVDFDYINPSPSALGGTAYYDEIARANWLSGASAALSPEDVLLTLSTCCRKYDVNNTGNHRLVVVARLLPADSAPPPYSVTQADAPLMPAE